MRWLKRLTLLLLVVALLVAAFFFWASGGTLPPGTEARLLRYEGAPAPAPRDTLTVMTYNAGYLSGMTNNRAVERPERLYDRNVEAAVALLYQADADVVGLQEIDFDARRSYGVNQLDSLARRLDYGYTAAAVNWDKRYLPFPYHWDPAVHFGRVVSGQAVLSRYPITQHTRVELARTGRPFFTDAFYLDRLAQIVQIDVGDRPLTVINVHLEAFDQATRERQATQVRQIAARHVAEGTPLLLIGDFNAPAPAARAHLADSLQAAFADDETIARLTDGLGLAPALTARRYAQGPAATGTFPADDPQVAIDHIFYTPATIEALEAEVIGGGARPPSDHRAVVLRFALRR